jgi:acyl-coenzyme A synthetase/AMP-(fatty) acid ligase
MAGGELNLWQNADGVYNVSPHKELALLLPTSGSTGDAKMVRLSYANIETNARSIAKYLDIKPGEVAIQSLPMHYSYGLSVLNSHLISGAAVAITSYSFMRPEFWRVFDEYGCTSFAGVPYMYETLHRLRMNPADRPTLRTLTQAGGHLKIDHVKHFNDLAASKGAKLFVMYGQTEATARISYVPAERLVEKLGSIGVAIPGGKLWVEPVEGDATARQLFYSGPNVMLGYASEPADLARGDEQKGVLATGDLAECDTDGYFRITGRLARFAKLFGKRINLASVEIEVEQHFGVRVAALDGGDKLRIFVEADTGEATGKIKAHLAALLGVPPLAIQPAHIDKLPLTASGKKDYKALR